MKSKLLLISLLFVSQMTCAALPPKYQNMKDLNVIIEFIKRHELVLETLVTIDFKSYTVHYGKSCKAIFGRKHVPKPEGWVGPEDPLEFKHSNCEID